MDANLQNIKELLKNHANLIIDDSLSEEDLIQAVKFAEEYGKQLTIIAKYQSIEPLKRIAFYSKKNSLTIDIREVIKRK